MLSQKLSAKFHKKLKERFFNTYNFFNNHNNKFISLLQKQVFALINIWLIKKNSMKLHYLKRIFL